MPETLTRPRTFTKIGETWTAGIQHVWEAKFEELNWVAIGTGLSVPMMPGENIKAIIKELRIPKVSHIAWNGVYHDRYGVYGIRGHYKNGRADVFILDIGSECVVLCSDLYPNT